MFADAQPDDGLLDVGVLTSEGPVQLARAVARTALGDRAEVAVRSCHPGALEVRVKLDRKVLYELDGGDRTRSSRSRSTSSPRDHGLRPACGTRREGAR